MSSILDKTDIPHPKIYDHKIIDDSQAIIIMEYVGPSLASLFPNDEFESITFVPPSMRSNPELRKWAFIIEEYVNKIELLGIDTQDNHEDNFCLKNGTLYVIDFEFWTQN